MLSLASSNAALVRQVLAGRRERFDVLVRRHLNAVYAVAYSFTTNHADAEDVAQDAFLKAYTSLNTLQEPAKFEGWVVAITRNKALRAIQRRQRGKQLEKESQDPAAELPTDPAQEELYRLLGEKIDRLDESHREVLMLHYFAGKRTRDIASLLNVSQAAVLKRLQRAREALGGEMVEEIVVARGHSDRVDARAKNIGKLVLAATAGWTVTKTGGGLTFGATLLTGRALAIGALGILGAASIIGTVVLSDPAIAPDRREALAAASNSSTQDHQGAVQPAERSPGAENTPNIEAPSAIVPKEKEPETVEEVQEQESVEQLSTIVETVHIDMEKFLSQPVGVVFENAYLWDIFEFIEDTYEVLILIDMEAVYLFDPSNNLEPRDNGDREYYSDGMFESIDMQQVVLLDILDRLCTALGLSYVSEPGFMWISVPSLIASEVRREPDARFAAYENEERASREAGLVFTDIHFSDVLDFVRDTYDVNIVLDYRVVDPLVTPRYPRPRKIPEGFVTDGWVPYISMRNVEMRDFLKAFLRPLNLTYRMQEDALIISSPDGIWDSESRKESLMKPDAIQEKVKATRSDSRQVRPDADEALTEATVDTLAPRKVTLLRVQEASDGEGRVLIESAHSGRRRWYKEDDAFEQYLVVEIDLESRCCTLLDEELGVQFELCLPEVE